MTTRLARSAVLATWIGSVVVAGLMAGFVVFLLLFWLFGKWENPSARLDAVLEIVGPCLAVVAGWAAVREWRRRGGRVPARQWWLVLAVGPGLIVVAAVVAVLVFR